MKVIVRDIMKDTEVNESDTEVIHFDWGWIGMDDKGRLLVSIIKTEKYNIYRDYPKCNVELNIKEVK